MFIFPLPPGDGYKGIPILYTSVLYTCVYIISGFRHFQYSDRFYVVWTLYSVGHHEDDGREICDWLLLFERSIPVPQYCVV